ncbi:MAG: B12-binding domain-containing radical SAM protein [Desulfobulbaceae bacterium]|nr:B12-binding domain-containing radical SAM protein [Desulfobulbaceae bacterium]
MRTLDSKKILLVHPLGYEPEDAANDISRKANIMPPLGLASIAAYLEQRDISVDLIDCHADLGFYRRIKQTLTDQRPAYIGFSCTTSSFLDGVRLSQMAKAEAPGIKVIFGGAHVAALKERILRDYPSIDYLVTGEGEETLYELINGGEDDPGAIEGLVYRDNGEPVFTGRRKKLLDLDSLPFPAYEKLTGYPERYLLPIFNYPKAPNTSCISSRGCPYACSYCDRSVFGRTFRYNSATYLYEHLFYLKDRFKIKHINFYDDQFTFNRARVEEFCNLMINKPLGMTFNCAVRAEHIDLDLLKLMRKAGCWMISLGIETGDEDLLAQHRQNANLNMLADKIRLIKKAGIRVKGLLMMGLPGESEKSIQKSMDYVFSLPIDDFNLSKFTPFPGSPLYKEIDKHGTFNEDWVKMDCMQFLFTPHGMSKEKLDELFIKFYKSHYTRPKVMLGYTTMLWKSPDSWIRFIKDFGHFISFARSNKRMG